MIQSLRAMSALVFIIIINFLHIINTIMIYSIVIYQISKLNLKFDLIYFLTHPYNFDLNSTGYKKTIRLHKKESRTLGNKLTNYFVESLASIQVIKKLCHLSKQNLIIL